MASTTTAGQVRAQREVVRPDSVRPAPAPAPPRRRRLALALILTAAFMVVLDVKTPAANDPAAS
jgi:hypothetical protein